MCRHQEALATWLATHWPKIVLFWYWLLGQPSTGPTRIEIGESHRRRRNLQGFIFLHAQLKLKSLGPQQKNGLLRLNYDVSEIATSKKKMFYQLLNAESKAVLRVHCTKGKLSQKFNSESLGPQQENGLLRLNDDDG